MDTFRKLLDRGAADDVAIMAPGCGAVSYASLRASVDRIAGQLRALGVAPTDRVAMVLPNGPEMAVAFLSVASCATAAPLNPKYREDEFRFYLNDLGAKALLTLPDDGHAAAAAAPPEVLRLTLIGTPDSLSLQHANLVEDSGLPHFSAADDVALVLHTSGTTSRPKIVPLTHRNLTTSAANIVRSLALTESDRCLHVMPLFHIHGLVAGLLAPLGAGSTVICTPGFDAFKFFEWLDAFRPTWYTAVPTMHQAILARAKRNHAAVARASLRFVRSSSASLPAPVLEEIERVFRAPMIEAYGMTEASHQMASNPLPPANAKIRSVGKATGIEIGIMDEEGRLLGADETGEVVIKGATVIRSYENNPEATAAGFTTGWFRTGDQGHLDGDGYLFLTGRLKEIINRGGEKVSPLEIDEVLLRHPAVQQAVAFGMPPDKLGEEVAAAVVLAADADVTDRDLRDFAAQHLTDFKVPRRIVILDEIPKGPTGKLQRIGLAEKLGLQ